MMRHDKAVCAKVCLNYVIAPCILAVAISKCCTLFLNAALVSFIKYNGQVFK